jgi:hypothetical protein
VADRFYTVMVVPERSDKIRRLTVPAWYMRAGLLLATAMIILGIFVFFDYLHVLSQVAENKKLRVENHLLKLDVQEAKGRLDSLDQTVGRIRSFTQKLRVLANLDNPGSQRLLEAPAPSLGSAGGGAGAGPGPGIPRFEEDSGSIDDEVAAGGAAKKKISRRSPSSMTKSRPPLQGPLPIEALIATAF